MTDNEKKLLNLALRVNPDGDPHYKLEELEKTAAEVIAERMPAELIEKGITLFAAKMRADDAMHDYWDQVRDLGISGRDRMGLFYQRIQDEAAARTGIKS